jgi:hypothetical protein
MKALFAGEKNTTEMVHRVSVPIILQQVHLLQEALCSPFLGMAFYTLGSCANYQGNQ